MKIKSANFLGNFVNENKCKSQRVVNENDPKLTIIICDFLLIFFSKL